jgi:hypothetical protein
MMTQDQHEHEMISSLIYDLKMVFHMYETTNSEIINTILSKVDMTHQNAINLDYTDVIAVCEELTERVGKLKDISKKQMIKQRAYDIIQTINW